LQVFGSRLALLGDQIIKFFKGKFELAILLVKNFHFHFLEILTNFFLVLG
jgi:hypothetical protein